MATGDKSKQDRYNKDTMGLYTAHRAHMRFDMNTWDAWYPSLFTADKGQADTDAKRYFYDKASRDKFVREENRKNGFVPTGTGYVLKGYVTKRSWNSRVRVRNAKFKVGDRVRIGKGQYPYCKDEVYVIDGAYDGGYQLKGNGNANGAWFYAYQLTAANSVRSRNAKFKVGDRVVSTSPDYQTKGVGVVRGYEYSWDSEIDKDDPGWYIVDFPNQYKVKIGKGSLRLANSRVRSTNAWPSPIHDLPYGAELIKVSGDKALIYNLFGRYFQVIRKSGRVIPIKTTSKIEAIKEFDAANSVRSRNEAERLLPVYSAAGKEFMKKAEAAYARAKDSELNGLWVRLSGELDRMDAIPDDEKDDIEENLHFFAGMVVKRNFPYSSRNAVVQKALNACGTVRNAAYSNVLKTIMDAVKPYMDKRLKGDTSWRYPMLVITVLRKICDRAVMSAGRYDGKRPPHRIYDIECEMDGYKFSGNLIVTGLLHRNDPDDVSAFDEYDMTLSLTYAGKALNAVSVAIDPVRHIDKNGKPLHDGDTVKFVDGPYAGKTGKIGSWGKYVRMDIGGKEAMLDRSEVHRWCVKNSVANAKWRVSFYGGDPDMEVEASNETAARDKAAKLREKDNRAVFGESLGYPQVKKVERVGNARRRG